MHLRRARLFSLFAAVLHCANASATACFSHEITWVKISERGELLVGGTFGTARSPDLGAHWSAAAPPKVPTSSIMQVIEGPAKVGDRLYLHVDKHLLVSSGFNIDFTALDVPSASYEPQSVNVARSDVATDKSGRLYLCARDEDLVLRYDPALKEWTHGRPLGAACDQVLVTAKTVSAFRHSGVAVSRDGAATWTRASLPFELMGEARDIRHFFADPDGTMYANAASHDGVRVMASHDGGLHWKQLSLAGIGHPPARHQILVGVQGKDLLILTGVGFQDHQDYRAELWRARSDNSAASFLFHLPSGFRVPDLRSIDATANGHIAIAATDPGGHAAVFVSADNGGTWTTIDRTDITQVAWGWCSGDTP